MALLDRAYNVIAVVFHHSDKGELVIVNHVIPKATTVSFSATQIISGISLEQYHANSRLDTETLMGMIADTMNDVLPADIKNLHVTSRHSAAGAKSTNNAHVGTIILKYEVVVTTTRIVEELMSQLTAAINDRSFNDHLCSHKSTAASATIPHESVLSIAGLCL